ncbi:unnamed protein product [Adineta ricciae]|uniref:GH16 domain-containing protein n=1 Tax=Adineta ricciae TaxID=249248 RepID=A0A814I8P1_ADIRI|nr:unnamed protein product [Adineta ricciae]
MNFEFGYGEERLETASSDASMEVSRGNLNELTIFDNLPELDPEQLSDDIHQMESSQKRSYPFNGFDFVTMPSIEIFAQPSSTQQSCTKSESKGRTVRFIHGVHNELNGEIYDCPAIRISEKYFNANRPYFICVTLTTVEVNGNCYIHPCPLEIHEAEYQKGIGHFDRSILYPINANTVDRNGIMKFDKLIIIKATQKDLKSLVPFELSNEHQTTTKRPKKTASNDQLKYLQLAFSVGELRNPQLFQPFEKIFSDVMREMEEGESEAVQSTQMSNGALIFYDNFQSDKIDLTKWEFLEGTGENGWGTHQKQYHTGSVDDNARCENGRLVIEARKQQYKGYRFTSARLRSRKTFRYGRLEIRARLPPAKGTWSSFLLLPVKRTYGNAMWPENGEINVMSHLGRTPGIVRSSLCTKKNNPLCNSILIDEVKIPDGMDHFKTYSLEWTPDRIEMFVRLNDTDENDTSILAFEKHNRDWKFWPFDQEFHLEIYLGVGGDVAGDDIDEDQFPQRFEIEYVSFQGYNYT